MPLVSESPDELEVKFPSVFPVCAVTPARSKKADVSRVWKCDLEDSFMADADLESKLSDDKSPTARCAPVRVPSAQSVGDVLSFLDDGEPLVNFDGARITREHLIAEQKRDQSLLSLFESVLSESELSDTSSGYYIKNDILLRKWTLCRRKR